MKMTLASQINIATRLLKCGKSRVWLDPARNADIENAITAGDVRKLISDGIIRKMPARGLSNFKKKKMVIQKAKGRRSGKGSRKGSRANVQKRLWISRIRAIRDELAKLREAGKIDKSTFRQLYSKSKSGFFRSRAHLRIHIEKK